MYAECFQPELTRELPAGVTEEIRETCSDPQCNDSTWDHACDLGERLGTYRMFFRGRWIPIKPGDYIATDRAGERILLSQALVADLHI